MTSNFSLVHFNIHLRLDTKNGIRFDLWSKYNPPYNAAIDFSYSFSKDSSPSDTSVTIHGLTRKHAKMFAKGSLITVWAGWANSDLTQNNYEMIFQEKITSNANMINEGGDWQTSFTCTDGQSTSASTSSTKSVRSDASDTSEIGNDERRALNNLKKRFGVKTNNINDAKDKIRKERAKLGPAEKAEKAEIMSEYPTSSGKGSTAANKTATAERKAARAQVQDKYTKLRTELKNDDDELTKQRHNDIEARMKKAKKIRTQYQAKKKRKRTSKSKKKSKSDKHKNELHFKKGTYASTIIRNLAKRGHIKLTKLQLVKNKKYTAGYTADKKPSQCINDIVQDCDSSIWWEHGKLRIGDFAKHTPLNFILSPRTGLMETPQDQDDDDSDDDSSNGTTSYEVNAIFLPFATAGSTFRIVDPESDLIDYAEPYKEPITRGGLFNNMVVVTSGTLEVNSGDTPTADLTVVPRSQLSKAEDETNSKRKAKNKKIKDRKDARSRRKTKAKRKARQGKKK